LDPDRSMDGFSGARRASAEFVGTAFLTLAIIGSGIAASRLSEGDQGFTLVANAIANTGPTWAIFGALVVNLMFGLAAIDVSKHARSGWELWISEVVATFGMVLVVFGIVQSGRSAAVPFAVGAYIAAAILFTSSTAFANPATTVARSLTDTFTGIALQSVPMFVLAEFIGAGLASLRLFFPSPSTDAE
jgi:glycerol uptake facilitator-like aquaporin